MNHSPIIRVVAVDDHPLVLSGLCLLLARVSDIDVVGHAVSGLEAIQVCEALQPDIVLMDLMMPGMNGLEATKQIVTNFPCIKTIIVTSYDMGALIEEVFLAGAHGYISKDITKHDLVHTIHVVAKGHRILPTETTYTREGQTSAIIQSLTHREKEILRLMVQGMSSRKIGERLGIQASTVKYHTSHIFAKLAVTSRTEAIAFAYHHYLIYQDKDIK